MEQNDPWAAFNPQTPGNSSTPILQRQPSPQTPAQAQHDQNVLTTDDLQHRKLTGDISDDQTKRDKMAQATSKHSGYAKSVLSAISEARGNASAWSTGFGSVLAPIPATQAHDLQANIDTITANIGFDRLQEMRTESPTGGALGQVSDFENRMLQSSMTALRQSQSQDQFAKHLDDVEFHYLNVLNTLEGRSPFKDLDEARRVYGNQLPAAKYTEGFSDEKPRAPVNPLSSEQQAAYDAWWKANPKPTAEQLQAFYGSITGGKTLKNAQEIIDAEKAGRGVQPGSAAEFGPADISDVRGGGGAVEKIDATARSAANVIPFMDEVSAGLNSLTGDKSFRENLSRERAIDQYDWEHNFPEVIGGTIAGGAMIPTKAGAAARAARSEALASGATEEAASLAARKAFTGQVTKEGAVYGTVSGVGSEGDLGERIEKGVTGGFVGATVGAVGGGLFGRKPPRPGAGGPSPGEIGQAMLDEGIPGARPIADPTKRGKMSYLETTRGGHNVVRDSLERTRTAIADKVAGIPQGEAQTPGGIGETVQNAGKRTLSTARARAGRIYERAAASAADNQVDPKEALSTLDRHIADLSRNPGTNRGVLGYLKTVRGDLAANKTVADIRDIRTGMSGEINRRNLTKTGAERIMGDVLSAARRDIERDLGKNNPDALGLYQQADDLWTKTSADKKQVVEALIGPADNPLSGEQTMARVRSMMGNKGDLKRFERVMNMLEPDEKSNFAATLFEGIGQRSPEEPFSPALFLSKTRDMQPEALKTLFGDKAARSIMNLRVASKGFADASSSLNQSRSGFVANFKDIVSSLTNIRSVAGGAAGFAVAGYPGAVAGSLAVEGIQRATNYLSAKSLMNLEVSRWIRAASKARTEREARGLIGKLNGIAASNAAVQGEVIGLRDFLVNAANDNFRRVGSAAASPDQRPDQQ